MLPSGSELPVAGCLLPVTCDALHFRRSPGAGANDATHALDLFDVVVVFVARETIDLMYSKQCIRSLRLCKLARDETEAKDGKERKRHKTNTCFLLHATGSSHFGTAGGEFDKFSPSDRFACVMFRSYPIRFVSFRLLRRIDRLAGDL